MACSGLQFGDCCARLIVCFEIFFFKPSRPPNTNSALLKSSNQGVASAHDGSYFSRIFICEILKYLKESLNNHMVSSKSIFHAFLK